MFKLLDKSFIHRSYPKASMWEHTQVNIESVFCLITVSVRIGRLLGRDHGCFTCTQFDFHFEKQILDLFGGHDLLGQPLEATTTTAQGKA